MTCCGNCVHETHFCGTMTALQMDFNVCDKEFLCLKTSSFFYDIYEQ